MRDFAVYYILANCVSILLFVILLLFDRFNVDRQEKQIKFDRALIAFILYFLTDCFWAALIAGMIPKTPFNMVSNVFLIYLFMTAISYFWLDYVLAVEQCAQPLSHASAVPAFHGCADPELPACTRHAV